MQIIPFKLHNKGLVLSPAMHMIESKTPEYGNQKRALQIANKEGDNGPVCKCPNFFSIWDISLEYLIAGISRRKLRTV